MRLCFITVGLSPCSKAGTFMPAFFINKPVANYMDMMYFTKKKKGA